MFMYDYMYAEGSIASKYSFRMSNKKYFRTAMIH